MHDQRSCDAALDEAAIDQTIMSLLLEDDCRPLWAVEEVAREVGDPLATREGLDRLQGVGLVHRLDGFVLATRSALHGTRIGQ